MRNKIINCIIPAYNVGRYLSDAIDSVMKQDIGFENVNLVIVNDGSTDNTEEVVKAYQESYPEIVYIYKENGGVSSARNAGLDFCLDNSDAPFTCFLDGDDKYALWHMNVLIRFLKKHEPTNSEEEGVPPKKYPDVAFVPIKVFERQTGLHYAYKTINRGRTRVIDLTKENAFFSHVNAAVFRTNALKDVRFNETLSISEDADFILKVIIKTNLVAWYNQATFYYLRKRADESSTIDTSHANQALYDRIAHYRKEFESYVASLGAVPRAVQMSRLYDVHWLKQESNDPTRYGLNVDVDKILDDVNYIISKIDKDLLEQDYISYWYRVYFKQMKYGDIYIKKYPNHINAKFYAGTEPLENLSGNVELRFIKQINNTLRIRGFFVKPCYDGINLVCRFNKQEFKSVLKPSYQNDIKYFLGRKIFPAMDFDISIDIGNIDHAIKYNLEFYFSWQGKYGAAFLVHSWFSRFYYKNTFFVGDYAIVRKSWSGHALEIERLSKALLNTEILSRKKFYKDQYLFHQYVENHELYRKKRIWLFVDRPNSIGDNGEALFRYCCNMDDGIEKYMVIPDESFYPNFEGVNPNIIIFGSFEFKFLLMFAEKVISSTTFYEYVNVDTNIPKYEFKKIVLTLSNVQEVFLQHGILQNKGIVNEYLNSNLRDFDMMVTSASKEYLLMLTPEAGYTQDEIKLTGMPRYDLLKSNPEKIITFIPTWRKRYIAPDGAYNRNFRRTDFFKTINDFINDPELLEALSKYGYRFIFKLHPKLQIQRNDFNVPKEVVMIADEISYGELYEKSALMVTDFSSAVCDFAYLKKPIVYYQTVEHGYEQCEEVFCYEKEGFGEVFSKQENAVGKIINYMKNGCKMEKKYQKKVDNFFIYNDQNNSERVYKEILKLPERIREPLI